MQIFPLHRIWPLRIWPLLFLLSSLTCQAEIFSAQAPIIDGDLTQARRFALRQILNNASLTGHIDVVAASALIGQQFKQRTLVTSQSRIREIRVISENQAEDVLTLTLELSLDSKPPSTCSPPFVTRQTALAFSNALNSLPRGENGESARLFLNRLSEHLLYRSATLWPSQAVAENPSYTLDVTIPKDSRLDPNWAFRLAGADGKTITTLNYALGKETLASRQTVSLGYANLKKLGLTRHGEQLSSEIAQDIAEILDCLPIVVVVPADFSDDTLRISGTSQGKAHGSPAFAFYSRNFPVGTNARIDPLRIDGILTIHAADPENLYIFPDNSKKNPGLTPGGFVILQ